MNKNDIDIKGFVKNLINKTNDSEINWNAVPKNYYSNLIDRTINGALIKDAYYYDGKTARVIVGKYESKVYYEEDEYYFDDHFFLTITDDKYNNPTTFLKSDSEIPFEFIFPLELSKLYRLIQINTNNIKNRLENFF